MPHFQLKDRLDEELIYDDLPCKDADGRPTTKTYRVPSVDALTGLKLTAFVDAAMKARNGGQVDAKDLQLDDDQEKSLYQLVLGAVYDEMLADGVSWMTLQQVGQHAFACFTVGADAAELLSSQGNRSARTRSKTRRTGPKTAGSSSSRESSDTPDRTRGQGSIPSSKTPALPAAEIA